MQKGLVVSGRALVVYLDGALVLTDTLLDCFFLFIRTQPHRLLILVLYLFRGKVAL